MYDPIRDRRRSAQRKPSAAASEPASQAGSAQLPGPSSPPTRPPGLAAQSAASASTSAGPPHPLKSPAASTPSLAVLAATRTPSTAAAPFPSVLRHPQASPPPPSSSSMAATTAASSRSRDVHDGFAALSEAAAQAAKQASLASTTAPQSPLARREGLATVATTLVTAGGQLGRTDRPSKKRKDSVSNAQLDLASAAADDESKGSKRSRNVRACDACRRKKIRCDAEQVSSPSAATKSGSPLPGIGVDESTPCGNCVRSSQSCTFSRVPLKRGPNKGFIQALEDRIRTLESSMVDTSTPGSVEVAPAQTTLDHKGKGRAGHVASSGPPPQPHPSAQMQFGGLPALTGPRTESETSSATPTTSPHLAAVPPQYRAVPPWTASALESPLTYTTGIYACPWQRCFSLLPPRYLTTGFQHPILRLAARVLTTPFEHPDEIESLWRVISDAAGAAMVGMSPLTPPSTSAAAVEGIAGKARSSDATEDEFYALLILYAVAARAGRLIGSLLGAAVSKFAAMTGQERDRAEWAHFQLDLWHALSTHQPPLSRLAPLRRDVPIGRSLLGMADDHPASAILHVTTLLAGLNAKARDASSWSDMRENEFYLTFDLQWAEDIAAAVTNSSHSNNTIALEVLNDAFETTRARLALFAKLYHDMRRIPLAVNATPIVVAKVVGDAAQLMALSDRADKLLSTEALSPHILGLASIALSWSACVAYALPRDLNTSDLIAESTARLATLAHLARSCGALGSSLAMLLAKIAHYADCFSRSPADSGDMVRQKFLDAGILGSF